MNDADMTSNLSPLVLSSVAFALVLATGCEVEDPVGEAVPSKAPTSAASPKAIPTKAPAATFTIRCYAGDFEESTTFTIDRSKPDFSEAWAATSPSESNTGYGDCTDAEEDGPKVTPISAAEKSVWEASDPSIDGPRGRSTLAYSYAACAEHDTPWYLNEWPVSGGQASEARKMLMLCPSHPNAAVIAKRAGIQDEFQEQIRSGETINDGTFRVGSEVKPGTYQVRGAGSSGLDCLWARKAKNGDVIASGGVESEDTDDVGERIVVTIAPSDYSFYTERCGVWFRIK